MEISELKFHYWQKLMALQNIVAAFYPHLDLSDLIISPAGDLFAVHPRLDLSDLIIAPAGDLFRAAAQNGSVYRMAPICCVAAAPELPWPSALDAS